MIITGFFSATWSGLAMIEDLDRGVIERFLATPMRRSALVLSQVARSGITATIQAVIILVIGFALGACVHGAVGFLVILATAALVAAGFSGISHGLALLTRREATMMAVVNFIALPLMFLSTILIAEDLLPGWIEWAARFNPVDWGAVAAREAVAPATGWGTVAANLVLLAAFAAATSAFATWAFRAYRRTL